MANGEEAPIESTSEEVVEAELVDEPAEPESEAEYAAATEDVPRESFQQHAGEPEVTPVPGSDLVRSDRSMEVMRPLDSEQLVESFEEYQKLRGRLLTQDDYQDAGRGKKFVKKSGWRKIATAFGLDVAIIRSDIERDEDGSPTRAAVIARASAPNGRYSDGDGYCDVSEDRFSGPRGNKSKLENDLRATATTRAKNRAISDLVGMGEVSAEEADGAAGAGGPEFGPESDDKQKGGARNAMTYLLSAPELGEPPEAIANAVIERVEKAYGYVPNTALGAIILLAKQVQESTKPQEESQ